MAQDTSFKTEFAVEMSCDDCVQSVSKVLKDIPDIRRFDIDLGEQRVVVEGHAPPSFISRALKATGRTVIVRGQGVSDGVHSGAAVCIFDTHSSINMNPQGLARFVQISPKTCLVDITVQGLTPGRHAIHIHESGDLSQGPASTGDDYEIPGEEGQRMHGDHETGHAGDLGNIEVDEKGWGDLVLETTRVKVWDVIGRSIVVHEGPDDLGKGEKSKHGNSGKGVLAGVIARSAGAFENSKKVCACSGNTLWEEARLVEGKL